MFTSTVLSPIFKENFLNKAVYHRSFSAFSFWISCFKELMVTSFSAAFVSTASRTAVCFSVSAEALVFSSSTLWSSLSFSISSRWFFLFSFYYLKISFFIKYKFSIVNTKLKRIFAIEIRNLLDSKNIKE